MSCFSWQNSCCQPTKEIVDCNSQALRTIKKLFTKIPKNPSIAVTTVPFLRIWNCFPILGSLTTWSCNTDQTDQTVHQSFWCSDQNGLSLIAPLCCWYLNWLLLNMGMLPSSRHPYPIPGISHASKCLRKVLSIQAYPRLNHFFLFF